MISGLLNKLRAGAKNAAMPRHQVILSQNEAGVQPMYMVRSDIYLTPQFIKPQLETQNAPFD